MSSDKSTDNMALHKKRMGAIREKMNRQNLKKVVNQTAIRHWSVKGSTLLVAVSVFLLILTKNFVFPFITLGAVIWGLIHFYYNINYKSQEYINEYVTELQQMLVVEGKRKRRIIMDELTAFGSDKGAKQVENFYQAFENLKSVLSKQFSEGEITYKRYSEAANEVLLSGIDNLQDIIVALKSISDIDEKQLKGRIQSLDNTEDRFEQKEKKILEKRLDMYEAEVNRIQGMLLENDRAVDQMKATTSALEQIRQVSHEDESDKINESIRQLQEMTNKLNNDV